jgi:hypothetical protein
MKYPVEKCLDFYSAVKLLEQKYKIDTTNLQPNVKTNNSYHDFNFYDFMTEKLGAKAEIFPVYAYHHASADSQRERYGKEHVHTEVILERYSMWEIPESYDSKLDLADFHEKKIQYMEYMKKLLGKKFKEEDHEKHVNFGPQDYGWANIFLELLHKEFSEYYRDGKIRVWEDEGDSGFDDGKKIWDYPWEKCYFYTDIVKYCDEKYGFNDDNNEFYEWILDSNYIEGRYWERPFSIADAEGEGSKLLPRRTFDKKKASETVEHFLNILEKDFSEGFTKNAYDENAFYVYMNKRVPFKQLKNQDL